MLRPIVIPAKAGIRNRLKQPDSDFHRNDGKGRLSGHNGESMYPQLFNIAGMTVKRAA